MFKSLCAAALLMLPLIPTMAASEFTTLAAYSDWEVEVYTSDNSNDHSCNLVTYSDGVMFRIEYWDDKNVAINIQILDVEETDPFPWRFTLHMKVDNNSPFNFKNASNDGRTMLFVMNGTDRLWPILFDEMSQGNRIYVAYPDGTVVQPGFSLAGSSRAIEEWKGCVRKLKG